ncbi:glycine cleavage system aminomethyltransferase GcvT [cf. Phormidesmis sp. LEGE 11477]|uniref:glycine cleavage system aminomethyltransferase GcvT n=1 Tax=cf. Phormidesmis sp. LEGE 11477 TaxID=1828680 RepID=UPI00188283A7|nr:glycine cleavage system aminomethyltransferase GcvT [cf. Phormidesmis sp. LEGE 11477]MBE9063896.1 glycine cleavage system aminomethyltransferase GcvT [cf. Phormidesmis sp. LEGE 11477]
MANLLRTPLHALYLEQKAKMMPFSGWEMPVQFSGILQEHAAVRQSAGAFDISHMGKFVLTGEDAIAQLQKLVPSDLSKLTPGKAQYTVLLNEQGGIIDDLIVYHQGTTDGAEDGELQGEKVTLIVNAGTTHKDKTWLEKHLTKTVSLQDLSQTQALIAVQGPSATAKLQQLCPDENLAAISRYGHQTGQLFGHPAFFARTGYTGEDGFEVMVPIEAAAELWQQLIALGVTPCGLGARDTLRLEAAMALYGQDIDDRTTPLEAGLSWLVHLDKSADFIGRSVLEEQKSAGPSRRLVGLRLEGRNIARHDYPILHNAESVGTVTSGTLSPTLGYPIALGYVPTALAKVGTSVEVAIRGKTFPATITKRPFYKSTK